MATKAHLAEILRDRIEARTARVAVVGLGSVGLPLASVFERAGFSVLGHDTDETVRAALARGASPLGHVPADVASGLRASARFELVRDVARLADADAVLLCLPTPLGAGRQPDLSIVLECVRELAPLLAPGALLVLESTTYPGTTRDVLGAVLREAGRAPGEDLFLAFSPERQDPGRGDPTATDVPKLVGGTCPDSSALAAALYGAAFDDVRVVSSAEVAEGAKLLENVFRAVNIALVNELKVILDAMDVDVWEVIEAAATKPFGFMKFTPGPGMGGHCIPVDPFYLAWAAREAGVEARFVELAGEINRAMPRYVVERTRLALETRQKTLAGSRVLLLGLAFKPDVDIVTESPAVRLFELFRTAGAEVAYSDPHVPEGPRTERVDLSGERSVALTEETLASFDVVVVATDHSAFDWELVARAAKVVVDTRNVLAGRMGGTGRYFRA